MRKYILGTTAIIVGLFYFSITSFKTTIETPTAKSGKLLTTDSIYASYLSKLYSETHLDCSGLSFPVFERAITGYYNLKNAGKLSSKSVLTIADFDQESTKKRLYVIDLEKKALVLNTWVAHGQNSGENTALNFSNKNDSFSSSLGFYVTGEVYYGSHGKSLKLDGMDEGFNNNARSRSIVVHGAPYVSEGTINALGRLGRSQGCPAVAPEVINQVIANISDKTLLFINKSTEQYRSIYLDEKLAGSVATDNKVLAQL